MKKILIIEDDPFVAKVYCKGFEKAGHDVATAMDGEMGLRLLEVFKPDLVQLDLLVPKVNGVEIIKTIRANPTFQSLPILVISSCYIPDLVKEAWKAGATKVMAKAECTPKLVLDRVEALMAASAPAPTPQPAPGPRPGAALPPPGADSQAWLRPELHTSSGQPEIRQAFLRRAPQLQEELRSQLRALIKPNGDTDQQAGLFELGCSVHALFGLASLSGLARISHMADALDILVKQLCSKPSLVTPSTLLTIARAVDCLGQLFAEAPDPRDGFSQSALILAVDDEPLSLRTVSTALSKAHLKAVCLDDPHLALRVLALNRFDLIFLDADMPGMDGFELCQRLRASPPNQTTPVVFVTGLSDFENRARSTSSGANDLIGKPYPLIELTVKALTFLLRGAS